MRVSVTDAVTESVGGASIEGVGRWVWVCELPLRVIGLVTDPVLVSVAEGESFSVPQDRVQVEAVSVQDSVRVNVCGAVSWRVAVVMLAVGEMLCDSTAAGEGVADMEREMERVPDDDVVRVREGERDIAGGAERVLVGLPVVVAVAETRLEALGVRGFEGLRVWVHDGDAERVEVPVFVLAYVGEEESVGVGKVGDSCRDQEEVAHRLAVLLRSAVAVLVAVRVTCTPVDVGVGVLLGPLEVAVGSRGPLPVPDRLFVPTTEGVVETV
mmetsp:Transcript_16445/g.29206  ORF Transcript_16445/g.29206 Transcript_16445/m.29206 type:complete len:269 (-) Transcript_16445:1199-2005(-)